MILNFKLDDNLGTDIKVHSDIIITPFFSEELCRELVDLSEYYNQNFKQQIYFRNNYENNQIGWEDLYLRDISNLAFIEYTKIYKERICPIIGSVFGKNAFSIDGWFSPSIIRYDTPGQSTDMHHDISHLTLNVKLNDNYEGCDLIFPRQNFSAKDVPVGHAMIWPSAVTHPHYSTPLVNGKKYSFVSWTWPPAWTQEGIQNG